MPWARIDDAFDDHPKVLAVLEHEQGGAAIGLWTLCLTWAHRNTLRRGKIPGVVPASLPRRYLGPGARELAALLVKEGLWDAQAEGDGWTIHDFDQYLPTEKTSAARAEAGRKGAASRWGKPKADGRESGSDGKESDGDGNLPSAGHDVDSNAEANDGSRAPARRAISKEIASRLPMPVPPTAAAERAAGPSHDVTAGTLVAEWIRSCRKRPPDRVIGQISGELKKLLDENHEVGDIRAGLTTWALAAKHPSTLASFVNAAMNGGGSSDPRAEAEQAKFVRAMERAAAREGSQ